MTFLQFYNFIVREEEVKYKSIKDIFQNTLNVEKRYTPRRLSGREILNSEALNSDINNVYGTRSKFQRGKVT